MISLRRQFATLLLVLLAAFGMAPRAHAAAGAYEAELPADLTTARDMCALVPCKDVFPGATHFSERQGQPPYVEAYDSDGAQKKLLGYVMLSTDITDTPAYSGKPVVTLIGMDMQGRFVGVKVLKHSEPILLLGIPESTLIRFNNQYVGRSVTDNIEVGPSRPEENVVGVDAISGATVTVIAQNQVVMASGAAVARQTGIIAPTVRESARFAASGQRYDCADGRGAAPGCQARAGGPAARTRALHRTVVRRPEPPRCRQESAGRPWV
jgi:Regulator of nitric oxide reductase transcription